MLKLVNNLCFLAWFQINLFSFHWNVLPLVHFKAKAEIGSSPLSSYYWVEVVALSIVNSILYDERMIVCILLDLSAAFYTYISVHILHLPGTALIWLFSPVSSHGSCKWFIFPSLYLRTLLPVSDLHIFCHLGQIKDLQNICFSPASGCSLAKPCHRLLKKKILWICIAIFLS